MTHDELPMGFIMALAQNTEALQKFESLSEEQKQEVINGTHTVGSKAEMRQYVNSIPSVY